MRQGKLKASWDEREAERVLLEEILAADTANGQARAALAVALRTEARLAIDMARPSEALGLARRALREAEAVVALDATDAQAAASAAITNLDMGEALEVNGDIAGAKTASLAAQRYSNVLTARDRRVAKWQLTEARGLLLRCRIAMAEGANAEALKLTEAAQATIVALPGSGKNDSDARYLLASASFCAGQALEKMGDLGDRPAALCGHCF